MVIWESDLRKPPSRAEFSNGTCFLSRLSVNLLKNHILFGNRLWKSQIWKWWFEETTFTSRILKRNMVFEEIKPQYIQKPRSFWKSALRSQIWKWWFEKTTFTSRILKRNVVFEKIKREYSQKPHPFWKSALKSQIWKWWFEKVIWENHLHEQNSQTERGFWAD